MRTYQYTDPTNTVVAVIDEDGISRMSMLASEVPAGSEILPYVPTPQQIEADCVQGTQNRRVAFARTSNFDGILSACTYATSTVDKFRSEGAYCVEARDATWAKMYEILAEVQTGTRPMPTGYADIEPDLPPLVWPDA